MAQRTCVTGAAGQAGRAVVRDLREHGYKVVATDIAVSRGRRGLAWLLVRSAGGSRDRGCLHTV